MLEEVARLAAGEPPLASLPDIVEELKHSRWLRQWI